MTIDDYLRDWRRHEVEAGRSPITGRKWRGLHGEIEERRPTKRQWAALARYRSLTCKSRRVDHRTAFKQAFNRDDPGTIPLLNQLIRDGILVGDFPRHY